MDFKVEWKWIVALILFLLVILIFTSALIYFLCQRRKRRRYSLLKDAIPLSRSESQAYQSTVRSFPNEKLDPTTIAVLNSVEVPKEKKRKEVEKLKSKKRKKEIEETQLDVRMYLRSLSDFESSIYQPDIGGRSGKNFFLVDQISVNIKRMLCITPVGQLFTTNVNTESKVETLKSILKKIEHPYILSIIDLDYRKEKFTFSVFREFFPSGSLRDLIHKSKPLESYSSKYSTVSGSPLAEKKLRLFSRQILEGMDYLIYQGFPCYHVHCGNVVIDQGVCKITDFENDYLGIIPKSHQILRPLLDKINPALAAFGSTLYEMSVGYPMDSHLLDDIPANCNPKAVRVLKKIFDRSEITETLQTLASDVFFAETKLYSDWNTKEITLDKKQKTLLQTMSKFTIIVLNEPTSPTKSTVSSPPSSQAKKKTTKKSSKESSSGSSVSTPSLVHSPPPTPSSAPSAPPPPPAPTSPPPPPPSSVPATISSPNPGRAALLDSIRNADNLKKLKKTNIGD